jgi:hypothetical protein
MKLDHPCKQTCSGWQQGRERGREEACKDIDQLKAKVERLEAELRADLEYLREAKKHIEMLHADLAKAVAALEKISGQRMDGTFLPSVPHSWSDCKITARDALAELKYSNQTKEEK